MTFITAVPDPADPFASVLPPESETPSAMGEVRDPPPKEPPG
ncbi:MAG TPA: hypothetical protein VLK84_02765 [Longimicrobium sp.]|nr:hypothetical protein [Longimicrobium sp.]